MNMNTMDRNRNILLGKISRSGFVLNDLALFLDTHPANIHALRHYEAYQRKHEALTQEYERMYGPLTRKMTVGSADRWNWIDGPWPWEREYNEEVK